MTGTKGKRDYLYTVRVDEGYADRKLYLNQRLCIIRSLIMSPEYLNFLLKNERFLEAIYGQSTGTANQANIGMNALNNWVLPIPPLQEQSRIVSKLRELFALCDRLKERIGESQKTANQMAEAVLEQIR
jgi:type I restriction enzyme, S subunit